MASGKKKTIKPIQKKIDVKLPDDITTSASLEDYEKVAAKMAMSSDDIIDAALDRMDAAPKKPAQPPRPTEPERKPEPSNAQEAQQPAQPQSEPQLKAEDAAEPQISALWGRIRALQAKLDQAVAANAELNEKIRMFKDETAALVNKNDDLILKNSELEFEISRVGTENRALKGELEKLSNAQRLPPQTYSKEAYTRAPLVAPRQTIGTPPKQVHPQIARPPRMSMNGYESWN